MTREDPDWLLLTVLLSLVALFGVLGALGVV